MDKTEEQIIQTYKNKIITLIYWAEIDIQKAVHKIGQNIENKPDNVYIVQDLERFKKAEAILENLKNCESIFQDMQNELKKHNEIL